MSSISLIAVEAYAFRVPIDTAPLVTAFGVMRDRPAVLVRVVDADGTEGWGEAWCNWPAVAAEHRARLVADLIGPRLVGRTFADPAAVFDTISRDLEVLVLQTAEVGPIAQAIAGVDIALWDLAARKAGVPVYRALAGKKGKTVERVPAYASGINPEGPEKTAAKALQSGHRAVKLKIGFGRERDLRNISATRAAIGATTCLFVDANQGYDLATAKAQAREIAGYDIGWYEEPIRADQPLSAWRELKAASPMRLAAGENLRGDQFDETMAADVLGVVQPDVAKWGGITGCYRVACQTVASGKTYCPHWLASGVGLLASLHLLAAAGGDGLLELDFNPNPLRELLGGDLFDVTNGSVAVPQGPGLGVTPDLAALRRYRTWPA